MQGRNKSEGSQAPAPRNTVPGQLAPGQLAERERSSALLLLLQSGISAPSAECLSQLKHPLLFQLHFSLYNSNPSKLGIC